MIIKNFCFISWKNYLRVYSRKNSLKFRREFQTSCQLTVSFIRLLINNFNKNWNQKIDDNMSIEKISERRKRKRMLLYIKRSVLSLTTIDYFKFVQKFELKINSITEDDFVKTLQIRHSIWKKKKWFFRARFFSQIDEFIYYSIIHNTEMINSETHSKIELIQHILWCHLRHFHLIIDHIKHKIFLIELIFVCMKSVCFDAVHSFHSKKAIENLEWWIYFI